MTEQEMLRAISAVSAQVVIEQFNKPGRPAGAPTANEPERECTVFAVDLIEASLHLRHLELNMVMTQAKSEGGRPDLDQSTRKIRRLIKAFNLAAGVQS